MSNRARGRTPKGVVGVELADRHVAVTPGAQRVHERTGAEARRGRADAEPGQLECAALALEQVARRGEGRVLVAWRALHMDGLVQTRSTPNQVRPRDAAPEALWRVQSALELGLALLDSRGGNRRGPAGCGVARLGDRRAGDRAAGNRTAGKADERDKVERVITARAQAKNRAGAAHTGHAQHGADGRSDAPEEVDDAIHRPRAHIRARVDTPGPSGRGGGGHVK